MDDQILHSIHQRIDEHHAHLCDRLDALHATVASLHAEVLDRLQAHEDYHRRCEHRFGLMRLAERHPLRLAAAAFAGGGLLLAAVPQSLHGLVALARALLRQWLP